MGLVKICMNNSASHRATIGVGAATLEAHAALRSIVRRTRGAVTLHGADEGDTATIQETVADAGERIMTVVANSRRSASDPTAKCSSLAIGPLYVRGYYCSFILCTMLRRTSDSLLHPRRMVDVGSTILERLVDRLNG